MAVSGAQKTRIGGQISGVGKVQAFTPKAAGSITETILDFGRGMFRSMSRGMSRGISR